jgi:hypothetical protein
MTRSQGRRQDVSLNATNEAPTSETEGLPCFCNKRLLKPKPKDYRRPVECRCCGKSYNAHNSCLEYKVAVDTKLFLCKDCFVDVCYCGSKHNGGERNIQTAICEIPKLDISKKHHWYFVLPKCLPEGCKVPSFRDRKKRRWQCWECSPDLYSKNNVSIGAPSDVTGERDEGATTIETTLVSEKKIAIMEASPNQKNSDDTIVTATSEMKKIEIIEPSSNQKNTDDTIVTGIIETNQKENKENVPSSNNKMESSSSPRCHN